MLNIQIIFKMPGYFIRIPFLKRRVGCFIPDEHQPINIELMTEFGQLVQFQSPGASHIAPPPLRLSPIYIPDGEPLPMVRFAAEGFGDIDHGTVWWVPTQPNHNYLVAAAQIELARRRSTRPQVRNNIIEDQNLELTVLSLTTMGGPELVRLASRVVWDPLRPQDRASGTATTTSRTATCSSMQLPPLALMHCTVSPPLQRAHERAIPPHTAGCASGLGLGDRRAFSLAASASSALTPPPLMLPSFVLPPASSCSPQVDAAGRNVLLQPVGARLALPPASTLERLLAQDDSSEN